MSDSLDQYQALLKVARADLQQEKQAIFGRLVGMLPGSGGRRISQGLAELAEEAPTLDAQRLALLADNPNAGFRGVTSIGATDELGDLSAEALDAQRLALMPNNPRAGFPQRGAPAQAAQTAPTQAATGGGEEAARQGLGPMGVAGLLGLGGAGAYAAHRHGRAAGEEEGNRKRNLAFGAGLATGAVAPQMLRQAGGALQSMSGQLQRSPYGGYQ